MAETFEYRDMGGTTFHGVNLGGSTFDDVNLAGSTITNANLAGVRIDNANVTDLEIMGIPIAPFIEAELDKRHPERVLLRVNDITDPQDVRRALTDLDKVREGFSSLLRAADPDALRRRPDDGKWSPLEHLRHLVFAEELYTDRWILRSDEPWSGCGTLPHFIAHDEKFAGVESQPDASLDDVLAAWHRVHTRTTAFVATITPEILTRDTSDIDYGQGTVGNILKGLANHDLHHILPARALLGDSG